MSRRGENIRKRKDGRWEGRYFTTVNGEKKYRSVYGHSYNEVKQKLFEAKKVAERQTSFENDLKHTCINELGEVWFSYMKNISKSSSEQYLLILYLRTTLPRHYRQICHQVCIKAFTVY